VDEKTKLTLEIATIQTAIEICHRRGYQVTAKILQPLHKQLKDDKALIDRNEKEKNS